MIDIKPNATFNHIFLAANGPFRSYEDVLSPRQALELGASVADSVDEEYRLAINYPATPITIVDPLEGYAVEPVDGEPVTVEVFERSCEEADMVLEWWRVRYPEENNSGEK